MGYTPELKDLIRRVEATRPARVEKARRGEHFSALSMDGRKERLQGYHPDYKSEGKRTLKVGPNKGESNPVEIVELLESRSRLPQNVNLSQVDFEADLLIIGGGGAGTSAALIAAEQGLSSIIATKLRHGDSNTVMAEGGIQGASQEWDSPVYHYLDTMGGGHFQNDPALVAALANDAPLVIGWLERLGMLFDKLTDGRMKVRHGGGTSRKRLHSAGDMTGAEIMRVLRDEARNRAGMIRVLEFSPAVELLLDKSGRCGGAVLYNLETHTYHVARAKAVVMATGGLGRLHVQGFPCTNHYGATGDGLAMVYRAGVKMRYIDAVQYHPTGAVYPEQNIGLLITEKVRGLGAHMLNIDGEQFCFQLEPRDIASACILRECTDMGKGVTTPTGRLGVWLDSPMIDLLHGEGTVRRELPAKFIQFKRYGIDISEEPMLIYPTLHYQNGGLEIDENGGTVVPGLYSAGEVTGGVHGRNRLMGNSLLDILVFGRRAALTASAYIRGMNGGAPKELTLDHVRKFEKELDKAGLLEEAPRGPFLLPDYLPDEVKARQWAGAGL